MIKISEFYKKKCIFITGVTGFLGKVLLEKLLRSCPDIGSIYVLVREKKGVDGIKRISQLLDSNLFDLAKTLHTNLVEKVIAINGDILLPNLGISEENRRLLLENVSIVFHSAATVKFDEPLIHSVQMNIIGVDSVLQLCQAMHQLEAFIHISTAYANCDINIIEEKIYPSPINPQLIISATQWMDDETIDLLTPRIIAPRPNTYTFTKAIAESLIEAKIGQIPCSIVRPSIVGASWNEPMQGWVDNFNGPSGLLAAIGKGMLRVMMGNFHATADLIPVDMTANLIIAAAWATATNKSKEIIVYNCTTGLLNKVTWGQMERASHETFTHYPLDIPIRMPCPKFTLNRCYHELMRYFDHLLPAWLMDQVLRLSGGKPIVYKLQTRLWKSVSCLEYFTTKEWTFENNNVQKLFNSLSKQEQQEFNFNVRTINWPIYLQNYCLGVKKYALKENLNNINQARSALSRLLIRHRLKQLGILITTLLLLWRYQVVRTWLSFPWMLHVRLVQVLLKLLTKIYKKLPSIKVLPRTVI